MSYYIKDGFQHEFTEEAKKLSFTVSITVSAEQIENIVVTALECQSTFWAGVDNTTPEWDYKPTEMPVSQYAVQLLLEGKSVRIYDIEDEGEQWVLTLDNLLKGIALSIQSGEYPEDECDSVLQYALFGEIGYA